MVDLSLAPEELALFIANVSDYAMFFLTVKGEIRTWNAGAERIMGYLAPEVVGRHFSIFYGADDLEREKPQHELQTAIEQGRVEDEGWRLRKDGKRFWANTVITALRDANGQLRGFAKITRDLTERREAEERLRRSEELFRLLVENVQDYAIFMLDPEGYISTWNLGASRIKGYSPEEIIGKHFSVFYTPEDIAAGHPQHNLELAATRGQAEEEGWRVRKDGSRFWANVLITAVHDDRGKLRGFAKVTRDITTHKEAEEVRRALLEQSEARLLAEAERHRAETSFRASQEANQAKDNFLMTLSHELRTPMTSILGWTRLLPAMYPTDPMFHEAIQSIGRSATVQAKLIDDVLDVSRIVSGKLRLSVSNVDILPLLEEAIGAVRPSADARGISIVTNYVPEIGQITVDPTRLQQVVWNLLSNAVKFTSDGGRVELSASRSPSKLEIAVSDTGEGIDPDFLPNVFEPFRQAETSSTRVHGGLGLGLSIVRYLVEAHGGTVSAESAGRGKGSRFAIQLPLRAVVTGVADEPAPPPDAGRPLQGRDILVVDDDPEGRQLIASALRFGGARVTAVDSAAAALAHARDHRPDLIVTDIAMPEMDGYALRRELREVEGLEGTKVAALTAFPPTAFSSKTGDFDLYLRKPIDPHELIRALGTLL